MLRRDTTPEAVALQREVHEVLGVDVAIATAEDTVIARLEWASEGGSERQLRAVAGILSAKSDSLDQEYLERSVRALGRESVWQCARSLAGLG